MKHPRQASTGKMRDRHGLRKDGIDRNAHRLGLLKGTDVLRGFNPNFADPPECELILYD